MGIGEKIASVLLITPDFFNIPAIMPEKGEQKN
jgi:hypothetical protein